MNPKNTLLLVVFAAALFAFIFFFERHVHPPEPVAIRVMPDFKAAEVTTVQIQLAGQLEIRAERTNGSWQLTKPLVYPAQSLAVENLLQAVAELSPQARLTAQELKGRRTVNEDYGFDKAQAILIFQQAGEQRTLRLGLLTAPGDQIYAQVVGLEGVNIIDADFFKKLVPRQANDWRDTSFVNLKGQDFDWLTVANGTQTFNLFREGTNQVWRMDKPVRTRADYPKIDALLLKLQNLRITRFVKDDDRADLEAYGLQPAGLELKFDRGTNHVLALQFGKSPTNDASQVYARRNGQNAIVLVPRESIAAWQAGFQEFRDRHLVRLSGGQPDTIEIRSSEENFTVQRQANGAWQVTQPIEFMADTNLMRAFITNLTGLEVIRLNDQVAESDAVLPDLDFPKYGLVTPARQYILKRSAPAGASNTVLAELDFGLAKEGKIFARRADRPEESSVYAVKVEDFQKFPSRSLQLRERRIWNFSEDAVSRIIIRQHGQTQELIHKGTNQWSIAAGSQGMINELEVEVGAGELGLLEAGDWVQCGDRDRARYGFSDQSLQIAVELKTNGKLETRKLDFGGSSPRGLRYGEVRMSDGQNWIFEFSATTLDRLVAYFNIQENRVP